LGGGGSSSGGSGQLPLIPDYDGQIWDHRGDAPLGDGGSNWGGGGGRPDIVLKPIPVPDMLTQGRCTKDGGDLHPECVATSCCCLDKLCVQALPQDVIQIADSMQVICPVEFTKHFHHVEDRGRPCSIAMHEFDLGTTLMATGRNPSGYLKWNPESWNNTENSLQWPLAIRNFERSQLADAGVSSLPDNIHMIMGEQFAQFVDVKSGCQSPGCLDCCLMLFAKVVSNNGAPECSIAVKAKCAPSGRLACELPSVKPWPGSPYKNDYFTPEQLYGQFTHGDEWKGLDITKKANGLVVGDCVS
jgi:hypothetical protein